jgi:two-component system, cell cycle response regulator
LKYRAKLKGLRDSIYATQASQKMTHPSLTSFKVYPLGFSAFEKSTIETFFRLAARRAPFWAVTARVEEASVLMLSAATRQDVDALSKRMLPGQQAVIVGSSDFGTGWPSVPRPLKLTALLASLSVYVQDGAQGAAQLAAVSAVAANPTPSATPVSTLAVAPALASAPAPLTALAPASAPAPVPPPVLASVPAPVPAQARVPARAPAAVGRPAERTTARPAEKPVQFSTSGFGAQAIQRSSEVSAVIAARNVLIVDDSDVALKFMQSRLRHFGYESKLARSGEEALTMTEKEDYQFVFLDVMMAGLDGYQTCRAIKLNKGKRPTIPVVVMLTSRGGTIDKIRGSMSGCDAYLTKPLNEQQLGMVLAQHAAASVKKAVSATGPARPATPANPARPAMASVPVPAPAVSYVSRVTNRLSQSAR